VRSLYISHTGLTDALGQAQVLPYIRGLAAHGHEMEVVSFEPSGTGADQIEAVQKDVAHAGITWRALVRARDPRLARKIFESAEGVAHGLAAALRRRPQVVHARSYLPAAVADAIATMTPGARLLFDCRGMLGDEYVDCGYWKRESLNYRLVKRAEKRLFWRSNAMVVLTDRLRGYLKERRLVRPDLRVQVVPCCADTRRFYPDADARARLRKDLGLDGRLVVAYSGSLGTFYEEPNMARFVGELVRRGAPVTFLVLSRSDVGELRRLVLAEGLPPEHFLPIAVPPSRMAEHLRVADLGLSFILPSFSKMGSSPTKVAEYLASGVPVVVNGDIGDQADLAQSPESCVVMARLGPEEIALAAQKALAMTSRTYEERAEGTMRVVRAKLGLDEVGIPRYAELYAAIADDAKANARTYA
jgi:glycosyltransferase involved in cell wall biosynthesis